MEDLSLSHKEGFMSLSSIFDDDNDNALTNQSFEAALWTRPQEDPRQPPDDPRPPDDPLDQSSYTEEYLAYEKGELAGNMNGGILCPFCKKIPTKQLCKNCGIPFCAPCANEIYNGSDDL